MLIFLSFNLAVCAPTCQNSGTCTAPNTCTCTSQWTGSTCATRRFSFMMIRNLQLPKFFQLFVPRRVKMVEHAVPLTLALVPHNGPAQHALRVRLTVDDDVYLTMESFFFSYLCVAMSKWWYLHSSQYLYMHNILGWSYVHYTYVKLEESISIDVVLFPYSGLCVSLFKWRHL